MITKVQLGDRIAFARKRLKLSQAELGKMFGEISHAAISDIERGKTNLGIEEITELAKILQVSFEELTMDKNIYSQQIAHTRSGLDLKDTVSRKKAINDFESYVDTLKGSDD